MSRRRGRLPAVKLPVPSQLLHRDLGALAFNSRVLDMARHPDVPLLERLRYLCIVSSNLDEFFEIRVSDTLDELRLANPGDAQASHGRRCETSRWRRTRWSTSSTRSTTTT